MQNDDELYRLHLAGDTVSYDALMLRYGDSLTLYLNGYLHNMQDAEDLMIEAFARIMVKKPKISEGNFKAYLFKTGRNLASRFHLVKSRIDTFSLEDMLTELADSTCLENMLRDEEKKRILHLCLDRIDPVVREALWLFYFENLSYVQAAEVMGVSVKKIDNLLTKGKRLLKTELEKEGVTHADE